MGPYLCLVRLVNCQNEILALKINVASQLSHFFLFCSELTATRATMAASEQAQRCGTGVTLYAWPTCDNKTGWGLYSPSAASF